MTPWVMRSPIVRAELAHQTRFMDRPRPWPLPIFVITWSLAFTGGFAVLLLERRDDLFTLMSASDWDRLRVLTKLITGTTLVLALVNHLFAISQTLQLAVNSIDREKHGGAWDVLLLTGVEARQLIVGKWGATLRCVWMTYRPLLLARVGVIASLVAIGEAPLFLSPLGTYPAFRQPALESFAVSAMIVAGFTAAHLALAAALGVLAALVAHQRVGSVWLARVLHLSLMFGASLALFLIWWLAPHSLWTYDWAGFGTSLFSLVDGGIVTGVYLYGHYLAPPQLFGWVTSLLLAFLLTWGLLRLAQSVAVRQGVLPGVGSKVSA